jgi:hypothetical protein
MLREHEGDEELLEARDERCNITALMHAAANGHNEIVRAPRPGPVRLPSRDRRHLRDDVAREVRGCGVSECRAAVGPAVALTARARAAGPTAAAVRGGCARPRPEQRDRHEPRSVIVAPAPCPASPSSCPQIESHPFACQPALGQPRRGTRTRADLRGCAARASPFLKSSQLGMI